MERALLKDLVRWQQKPDRCPLLLRGARQVGKTYIVRQLGNKYFENFVEINFEKNPEYKQFFQTLDPKEIISQVEIILECKIQKGKTLLFFDEIQECPKAIMALRYFKEEMQDLHVVGAGSLLEFVLHDENFRMPVGRVEFLFLYPLSFGEFLAAIGKHGLVEHLAKISLNRPPTEMIHNELLKFTRQYFVLGGMPAVIAKYKKNQSVLDCQAIQTYILQAYRQDFGKYAKYTEHKYLELIFRKAPGLISEWIKYKKIDPDCESRPLKKALSKLSDAGLIHLIYATKASGLPLISQINERKFKLLFLDVGLAHRACGIEAEKFLREDLMLLNKGALAEQFVGQELLSNHPSNEEGQLFFWQREQSSSSAEVDYVHTFDSKIMPVEVKAGKSGRLRALQIFLEEKAIPLGFQISSAPLTTHGKIISVPLYLTSELNRLIGEN